MFFADRIGNFIAADAETGKLLWHFNTGGTIRASPMSYAHNGRQYVAVTTKNGVLRVRTTPEVADIKTYA